MNAADVRARLLAGIPLTERPAVEQPEAFLTALRATALERVSGTGSRT